MKFFYHYFTFTARAAVLNGVAIPAVTVAVLSARGVDVGELETRIRQSMEFVR